MNLGQRAWADMAEYSLALIVQQYAVGCSTECSVAQGRGTVNDATRAYDAPDRFLMATRLMV